jgi:hypothetical protein
MRRQQAMPDQVKSPGDFSLLSEITPNNINRAMSANTPLPRPVGRV